MYNAGVGKDDAKKGSFAMPGPQFLTPRPVSRSKFPRRFTLQQANRSLSLVRRVVSDIVHSHGVVTELQAKLTDSLGGKEQQAVQKDLDRELTQLHGYIDELSDIGCELKDLNVGLVDFIGRHQHRDVYLCWKLGEESVGYFHEIESGYASRQPVSLLEESE